MNATIDHLRRLPSELRKNEVWRRVDFEQFLVDELQPAERQSECRIDLHCNVPNLNTTRLLFWNGYYYNALQHLPNGIIYGSLREARQQHPDLMAEMSVTNPYSTINAEGYTDGLFLFIPDNVDVELPIQLQSVIDSDHPVLIQTRNYVHVGQGSRLSLILCDDSGNDDRSFSNNVTQLHVGSHAHVQLYKMQNLNDHSALLNQTFVEMQEGASLLSMAFTFNGGNIRNHTEIRMLGEHCTTEAHGLYLLDKEQHADNYVFVDHAKPNCNSQELYKGIMDDSSSAVFNGHVLVEDGATKTEAYQTNRNILLTDKASIDTKPFLEIYNDDVKCSHGSTTGQLDDKALFYLRSRGISEHIARTLLLAAFCDEVTQKVEIPALRDWLGDICNRRLHGEFSPCSDCYLNCSTTGGCEKMKLDFHLDTSKL